MQIQTQMHVQTFHAHPYRLQSFGHPSSSELQCNALYMYIVGAYIVQHVDTLYRWLVHPLIALKVLETSA